VLDLRAATKALNGFVVPLQLHPFPGQDKKGYTGPKGFISTVTGRIHTHFNQLDTSTGRFANKQPNFQQMPSQRKASVFDGFVFRRAFVPPAGYSCLIIDYATCEFRILAELTQDAALIRSASADDPHVANAAVMFNCTMQEILDEHEACKHSGTTSMRQMAKTGIFTIVYGGGAKRVAAVLKCSVMQAQSIIDTIFSKFPGLKKWIDNKKKQAAKDGCVVSLGGRKRYFDVPKQPVFVDGQSFDYSAKIRVFRGAMGSIERQAQNAPVQATNADITKYAMILVAAAIKPYGGKLILTIHDELVAICPTENAESCYKAMETAMLLAEQEFLVHVESKVDGCIADHWRH
jgi:DNA polymerase-1